MDTVNQNITINDIFKYYNITGMSIGVAVGLAGKDFLFSLVDDIILPSVSLISTKISGSPLCFLGKYNFEVEKFFSALLSFIMVTFVVIIILFVVFRPVIKYNIIKQRNQNHIISSIEGKVAKIAEGKVAEGKVAEGKVAEGKVAEGS
jgi:large-conductance mechanosensitive channel